MNCCIKTGAVVHLESHDVVFAADLFRVGNAVIVRANGPIVRGRNCFSAEDAAQVRMKPTHLLKTTLFAEEEFIRPELGMFVVKKERIVEVLGAEPDAVRNPSEGRAPIEQTTAFRRFP